MVADVGKAIIYGLRPPNRDAAAREMQPPAVTSISQTATLARRPPVQVWAAMAVTAAFAFDFRFRVSEAASFTVFEILAWILAPIVVLSTMWTQRQAIDGVRRNWGLVAWVLWAAFAGGVSVLTLGHTAMVPLLKNTLPAVWLFLIIAAAVRSRRDLEQIILVYFVAMGANCVLALSQVAGLVGPLVLTDVEALAKMDFEGGIAKQAAYGTFGHPNNFGLFLAPAVVLAAAMTLTAPKAAMRTLAPAFLLVGIPALYFTFMKSAMGWAALGVALAFVPKAFRRPLILVLAVTFVSWLIFALGLLHSHENRFLTTLITRVELWQNAWVMITKSPSNVFLGADPMETAYRAKAFMGWLFPHAHNGYINQALYFGIPAGAFFIVGLFQAFAAANRAKSVEQFGAIEHGVLAMGFTFAGILILENLSTTNLLALPAFISALALALAKAEAGQTADQGVAIVQSSENAKAPLATPVPIPLQRRSRD